MRKKESAAEMLERLRAMSQGHPHWDLSKKDKDAIKWVLNNILLTKEE